jgi:uncharacterized membrane-anchored protein
MFLANLSMGSAFLVLGTFCTLSALMTVITNRSGVLGAIILMSIVGGTFVFGGLLVILTSFMTKLELIHKSLLPPPSPKIPVNPEV